MGRMEGKVAIVTGGARGLGRATCLVLAKEGASVAVIDILDDKGKEVAAEIIQKGGTASYYHLDVTSEEDVKRCIAAVHSEYGKLDVLVNNAGISGKPKPTHEISEAEWYHIMDIDAKGVFLCSKHTIPYMRERGGSIINISSVYGIVAGIDDPPPYVYHAAKGAVRLMTKSDAVCYARDNIRVNSIHPGFIWTPLLSEIFSTFENPDEFTKSTLSHLPLGRFGEPEDVAYGVLYLASDESKFVTGSELVIDGGYISW